jgi:anti-sigma regulatory factor (Ser/Thr protein kinase)
MTTACASKMETACDLSAVRTTAEWLKSTCADADSASVFELELALVEAITNLVKHSGLNGSDEKIVLEINRRASDIELLIIDTGKPRSSDADAKSQNALDFDPEDIENLPANGLGLAIIREATDEFDYESANGRNVLRLIKRLEN